MSEFSSSFHLRSNELRDGVELLRRARVPGFVHPQVNGWVPVVFPHGFGMEDKLDRILASNRGLAVHYDYAEDHGVRADAYRGSERVAQLYVSFESNRATFEAVEFVALGRMSETSTREIQQWIDGTRHRGLLVVAASLGLPRHSWFSYDYESRARPPATSERVEVSTDGTIVEHEEEAVDTGAPPDESSIGPLFRLANHLLGTLIDRELLVLTTDADVDVLTEELVEALSERDEARPEVAVLRCLTEHSMVDEVFADEEAIGAAMQSTIRGQTR